MSAADQPAAVELDVIKTAQVPMPLAYVFRPKTGNALTRFAAVLRPGAPALPSPCLAYVVRHPDAGVILVDTGFHPDAGSDLRRDFGLRMSLLFRNLRPTPGFYAAQLAEHGVDVDAVSSVVMTHLHVDHTSGMRLLPNAEFVCSRPEWEAATGPSAASKGYVAGHLPSASRMRLLDLAGEGEPFEGFERTIDLLGDGSIRLVSTPGHTVGHMSVLLRLRTGRVLIVGDAVYTLRSLREEILPLLTEDDGVYLHSLRQLRTFASSSPDATLVPSHDPEAWTELPASTRNGDDAG